MASVNIADLHKQYQSEQATIVDPGTYTLEVTRCTVRNDNALLPIFKITEGADAGKTVIAGQLTLTEKAASIFFRNLKGFGITGEFFATVSGLDEVAKALVGRVVEIDLETDQYNGEDRNRFKPGAIRLISLGTADGTPAGIPPAPAPVTVPTPAAAVPPPPPAPPAPSTGDAPPF